MTKIKLICTCVIVFLYTHLNAQNLNSGIIIPKDEKDNYEKFCCVLIPNQGFEIFNKPNGLKIGILKRDSGDNFSSTIITAKSKTKFNDLEQIGYEIYAITYVDKREGYLRLASKADYWIKETDIVDNKFVTKDWMSFLIKESPNVLGYYANEPGLKVRKDPNTQSEILGVVHGELYEIKLTDKVYNKWCFVRITKYKEHPCNTDKAEAQNIEFSYEGWVKIIDDVGKPNVWKYARGC